MLGDKPVLLAIYGAVAVALALDLPFALRIRLAGGANETFPTKTQRMPPPRQLYVLWLLAAATLLHYDAVYKRDVALELGDFRAIRYVPRSKMTTDHVSADSR